MIYPSAAWQYASGVMSSCWNAIIDSAIIEVHPFARQQAMLELISWLIVPTSSSSPLALTVSPQGMTA